MDTVLPVWTIRPNWRGGVLERLEWLTDVMQSSSGAEQRRSVRLTPRRSVEITVNPTMQERTFLDLMLHKLGSVEWLFPLWFDKARLAATANIGANRINFENTFCEHGLGTMVLLYKDTFTWEVVGISASDAGGLDLSVPLAAKWGKGTAIYPLRAATISADTSLAALSSRVGESVILFTMSGPNDYPEIMPAGPLVNGYPVMSVAPNRKQTITTDHTRLTAERDGQVGLRYRQDSAGRAFAVQSHNWLAVGRPAQSQLRSMLYWMRGRQRAVWLPTFNEDVVVSRAVAVGGKNLDIYKVGMGYVGGVVAGRDRIWIGGNALTVTAMGAPQSAQEERLRVEAGFPAAIPARRSGSFLDAARLDTDTIELHHHADTNGAVEVAATFRTFANIRQAAGTIYYPTPLATKNSDPCGVITDFVGLTWQLPCFANIPPTYCSCARTISTTYTVGGDETNIYQASVRVRGAVERNNNVYNLVVSDPPQTIRLNPGQFLTTQLIVLDYMLNFQVRGRATITLFGDSLDSGQVRNVTNVIVPDNDPSRPITVPQPYNGQFIQIDGTFS